MSNENYQTLHGFVDGGGGICGGCGHTIAHPSHGKDIPAPAESAPAPAQGKYLGRGMAETPTPVENYWVKEADYAAKCAELQKAESERERVNERLTTIRRHYAKSLNTSNMEIEQLIERAEEAESRLAEVRKALAELLEHHPHSGLCVSKQHDGTTKCFCSPYEQEARKLLEVKRERGER